jgi:homoserine kinase
MLSEQVPLKVAVQQTSNLAGFLLGCTTKNYALIQDSLKDVLIEPQRASLIPGFYEFQKAARQSGALGCSISGSGPAIFCLVRGSRLSEKVLAALQAVAKKENISLHAAWVSGISSRGARLVKAKK